MANYYERTRTNRFHVTDEKRYKILKRESPRLKPWDESAFSKSYNLS